MSMHADSSLVATAYRCLLSVVSLAAPAGLPQVLWSGLVQLCCELQAGPMVGHAGLAVWQGVAGQHPLENLSVLAVLPLPVFV